MRVVDVAVFTRLEEDGFYVPYLHEDDPETDPPEGALATIHDGFLLPTPSSGPVKIQYALPYAVYYSNVGDDDDENPRLIGKQTRRSVFFSFTIVGADRWQVKWAGERIRDSIQRSRIAVPGYKPWLPNVEESQRIRRDDDAIRPDGAPLFYGVDSYALSLALNHQGVLNG